MNKYKCEKYLSKLQTWLQEQADNVHTDNGIAKIVGGAVNNDSIDASPNVWRFVSTRDRNRAGQDTIHQHLYLALAEREQMSKLLHEYSAGITSVQGIMKTSQRIKHHFAKAREYLLSFCQDRFSMNLSRVTNMRCISNQTVSNLYHNLNIRDFPLLSRVASTNNVTSKTMSSIPRINHEIKVVNRVFQHFEHMIRCMNNMKSI